MAGSSDTAGSGRGPTVTSKRLRKLLDEGRLTLVGSASLPARHGRVVVVADEIDPPEHQRLTITTR